MCREGLSSQMGVRMCEATIENRRAECEAQVNMMPVSDRVARLCSANIASRPSLITSGEEHVRTIPLFPPFGGILAPHPPVEF